MKNKLKENIMVTNMTTKSWIEKIREAIRVAMNKGLHIKSYKSELYGHLYDFNICINNNEEIHIAIFNNCINLLIIKLLIEKI